MVRRKWSRRIPRRRVLILPARPISRAGPLARARRPPLVPDDCSSARNAPNRSSSIAGWTRISSKKDFVTLRMSVDKGGQARLIYVTSKGAGQIPFPIFADRKPHSYVIEPWTSDRLGRQPACSGTNPFRAWRQHGLDRAARSRREAPGRSGNPGGAHFHREHFSAGRAGRADHRPAAEHGRTGARSGCHALRAGGRGAEKPRRRKPSRPSNTTASRKWSGAWKRRGPWRGRFASRSPARSWPSRHPPRK